MSTDLSLMGYDTVALGRVVADDLEDCNAVRGLLELLHPVHEGCTHLQNSQNYLHSDAASHLTGL